jgi:hypothetical protein
MRIALIEGKRHSVPKGEQHLQVWPPVAANGSDLGLFCKQLERLQKRALGAEGCDQFGTA